MDPEAAGSDTGLADDEAKLRKLVDDYLKVFNRRGYINVGAAMFMCFGASYALNHRAQILRASLGSILGMATTLVGGTGIAITARNLLPYRRRELLLEAEIRRMLARRPELRHRLEKMGPDRNHDDFLVATFLS